MKDLLTKNNIALNFTLSFSVFAVLCAASEFVFRVLEDEIDPRADAILSAPEPAISSAVVNQNQRVLDIVGESSILAEPYDQVFTLGSVVKLYLQQAYPRLDFFVNIKARGGATFKQLLPQIKESLDRRPSVMLLFVGNNDFLGDYSHNKGCISSTSGTKWVFRSSRLLNFFRRRYARKGIEEKPEKTDRKFFDVPIVCDDEWEDVIRSFRSNILTIAKKAKEKNIPLVLFVPASNLIDYNPNRSVYRGDDLRKEEFERFYWTGKSAFESGDFNKARIAYEKAREIDPTFAEVLYQLGKTYRALRMDEEALNCFVGAKENDAYPMRALAAQQEALREAGRIYGTIVVDAPVLFAKELGDPFFDVRIFHDMHHPTLTGYNTLALAAAKSLLTKGIFGAAAREINKITNSEILKEFKFARFDWLGITITRQRWNRIMEAASFDPVPRRALVRAYLELMSEIDNAPFLYERPRLPTDELPRPDSERNDGLRLSSLWNFIDKNDPSPVHISGVPSYSRVGYMKIIDGADVTGLEIRIKDKVHPTGFGAHPSDVPSVVRFKLEKKYKSFSGAVGISDSGTDFSSCHCAVFVDGKRQFDSPVLKWKQPETQFKVSVAHAEELALVCDDAGNTDGYDHVVWTDLELGA